jgi:serine/threonine protein kinase
MGRYQLLHPVRRDRHGMIHIGRGPDGWPAAVRVLSPELATPAVRRRAVADRAALAGVRHPNLARVRDIVVADEVMIAEDAFVGRTLHTFRRPIDAAEFLRIGAEVAAGLHALHESGLLHGTLGPASVLVERDGDVRLTDIAVGRLLGLESASVSTDLRALAVVLTGLWRDTHRPWQRPPGRDVLTSALTGATRSAEEVWHGLRSAADVWVDTMARARDMG